MDGMDNTNKIAIVTGAASGIGLELSKGLVQMGCVVHGVDILKIPDPSVIGHVCDISNPDEVMKTIGDIIGEKAFKLCKYYEGQEDLDFMSESERVLSHNPYEIDYLINAAGIFQKGNLVSGSFLGSNLDWEKVMNVNINGMFYMSKYIFPWIKPGGCILNFSSEQVHKANDLSSPYAVSKAAVEMLSRILAIRGAEIYEIPIRVNTIALATVRTKFIMNSGLIKTEEELAKKTEIIAKKMPCGMIETKDVWELVKYLLFDGTKITGQTILMDSGVTCKD